MDTLTHPAARPPSSGDSSKASPSDPAAFEAEELDLMRLTLFKAGVRVDGVGADGVRAAYREYRRQQAEAAKLAEVQRQEDAAAALEAAQVEKLAFKIRVLGGNPEGLSPAEMAEKLVELQALERAKHADADRQREEERRAARATALFEAAQCPRRHVVQLAELDGYNAQWMAERDMLVEQVGYQDGFLVALLGIRGNGKTELGVSVIQHATQRLLSCRYIKAINLFRELRSAYTPVARGKAGITEDAIVQRFVDYDLLVIDEAHQRAETDFEQNTLINLLDQRYDAMGCTILIGNQTRADFAAAMGESLISRIHQTGEVIECGWPSYRKPIQPGQRSDAWKSRTKRTRVGRVITTGGIRHG